MQKSIGQCKLQIVVQCFLTLYISSIDGFLLHFYSSHVRMEAKSNLDIVGCKQIFWILIAGIEVPLL